MNILSQAELAQAKRYATGDWALLRAEADTGIKIWVKREGTKLRIRETQDVTEILEQNKARLADWSGWRGKGPMGAIVYSMPEVDYWDTVKRCGWDGVEYDRLKFNKILNDSENRHWRTGGGRLKTVEKREY